MPVVYYLYMAIGSMMLGMVLTFVVLFFAAYFGIDISRELWVLAIPVVFAIFMNVLLIELFRRRHRQG